MPSIFPWLNLPPPSTHGVSNEELPTHIQLGEHRLTLQPDGTWHLQNSQTISHNQQLQQLKQQINDLTQNGLNSSINKSAFELEQYAMNIEQHNYELQQELDKLKFQNKLLLAMCAISEADYQKLCQEAGWDANANNNNNNNNHNHTQSVDVTVISPNNTNAQHKHQQSNFNDTATIVG